MKTIILAATTVAALLGTATVADARQGCGVGFHRGPRGACIANRPNVYYSGYGWWDGHRYWHNRYRWHGGWRYR
jgi:hypothetical protein